MKGKERNEREIPCPRCAADAEWSFLDLEKRQIEVICPDCGRYEMTREAFDQAVIESAELDDPERR